LQRITFVTREYPLHSLRNKQIEPRNVLVLQIYFSSRKNFLMLLTKCTSGTLRFPRKMRKEFVDTLKAKLAAASLAQANTTLSAAERPKAIDKNRTYQNDPTRPNRIWARYLNQPSVHQNADSAMWYRPQPQAHLDITVSRSH